ncbi:MULTISPECIES: MDR family MFS transporter [unclassified Enterococcus]|jgi:EmrB/QacA subfamily drug resistance transporter|uniref:MDR family MFS transporter n=1 Tax=unclassified Enterococcus TaxID=2608891 RepID=UPI003D295C85
MTRKTNVALVTVCVFIATFMTAVEGTIVTTAMPTIVGSLHGMEIMNWVFSIYLLTNAMLTPIYGKLADKVGRKPIFIIGTFLFIIGSLFCGLSQTMLQLIASRALQGMGAGAMMPVALTIIGDLYSIEKRAKVLGLNSSAWGIASVLGPLAGGFIVDAFSWHWIFFINVPIGLVLILLIWIYLNEPKVEREAKPMDILGSLTLMGVLLTMLLGFQLLGEQGITLTVGLLLIASVVLFGLFIVTEKRVKDPVIALDLFKNPTFVVVNLAAALASGFLMGIDVYIPMWMQGVLGLSAAIGGLVLAPLSLVWMLGSFLASRWMVQTSVNNVLRIGLFLSIIGGVWLYMMPFHSEYIWFSLISAIIGVGLGITMTTSMVSAQTSVSSELLGVATSFNTLVRTIGQTIMVAVFGLLINFVTQQELAEKQLTNDPDIMNKLVNPQTASQIEQHLIGPLRNVLYDGLQAVFLSGVLLVVAAFALTFLIKERKKAR